MIKNNTAANREQPIRTLLLGGIIASVKIPKKVRSGSLPGNSPVKYFQFGVHVEHGCINVFLHSDDTSLVGTHVRAHIEIYEKRFEDGRRYLYVDLHPAEDRKETNNLFVVRHHDVEYLPHWQVFETSPEQGRGLIIIAKHGEEYPQKIEPKAETSTALPAPAADIKPDLPARVKPPKVSTRKVTPSTDPISNLADLGELLTAK